MPTTDRMSDEVAADLLSRAKETADHALRNQVVEAHLPLARHICGDYGDRGIEHDDLFQVATVGLLKAADRFDAERGVPFAAYASTVINGEIKRWFRDKGWAVRPPRSLIELGTRISGARSTLSQQLGRTPTPAQIADHLDVDVDDVLAALEASEAYSADSLTRPSDDGSGVIETPAVSSDDEELRRAELRNAIESLLSTLDDQERQIVRLRFWDEMSQSEIADIVGVSQMQISRVLRRVLRRLRTTGGFTDD